MAMLQITTPNQMATYYAPEGVRIHGDNLTVEVVAVDDLPADVKRDMGGVDKINEMVAAQAVTAEGIYGPDWADETKTWAASRPHSPF